MGQIKLQSVLLFEFKQFSICHCLVLDQNIRFKVKTKKRSIMFWVVDPSDSSRLTTARV